MGLLRSGAYSDQPGFAITPTASQRVREVHERCQRQLPCGVARPYDRGETLADVRP